MIKIAYFIEIVIILITLIGCMPNAYEQAIENYSQAIASNLKDVEAYYNRGVAYYDLVIYERAYKAHERRLIDPIFAKNPSSYYLFSNEKLTNKEIKRFEQAIEDFSQAIKLNPKHIKSYLHRGDVYETIGQYEQAIEDFNQAKNLDPKYIEIHYKRGVVYKKLGQYEQALEDFNTYLKYFEIHYGTPKIFYGYAQIYYNRGFVFKELGQYEQAIEDFNTYLSLTPSENYNYLYKKEAEDWIRKLGGTPYFEKN